jgi:ACS family D-galactonate transporter-like MFS transporter
MGWIKVGFFTVLPFIAHAVGVLTSGVCSACATAHGFGEYRARSCRSSRDCLLPQAIVIANFVTGDTLVIAIMSVAFFGTGHVQSRLDAAH